MVVGARDTGKSTFVRMSADEAVARGVRTWVVDADVGQSDVGPPTTVGARPWPEGPDRLYFVGSDSPRGHMLQAVVGTARLVQQAREAGAALVLINTTGWIEEGAAAALKTAKIDAVRPDFIVAFEAEDELRHILAPFEAMERPRVVRRAISPGVVQRSPATREAHRRAAWEAYLRGARRITLDWSHVGLSGGAPRSLRGEQAGRAVGLFDERDECVAAGPIVEVRLEERHLTVLAPVPAGVRIARAHLGSVGVPGHVPEPPRGPDRPRAADEPL